MKIKKTNQNVIDQLTKIRNLYYDFYIKHEDTNLYMEKDNSSCELVLEVKPALIEYDEVKLIAETFEDHKKEFAVTYNVYIKADAEYKAGVSNYYTDVEFTKDEQILIDKMKEILDIKIDYYVGAENK